MVKLGGDMRQDDSVIQSEVIGLQGGLTTVRAYIGRSIVSPVCELTLPTELFTKINGIWLQAEDAITHIRYRVKMSSVGFEGRRLPVYRAQEIR